MAKEPYFVVGGSYRNRHGRYEVLEIQRRKITESAKEDTKIILKLAAKPINIQVNTAALYVGSYLT